MTAEGAAGPGFPRVTPYCILAMCCAAGWLREEARVREGAGASISCRIRRAIGQKSGGRPLESNVENEKHSQSDLSKKPRISYDLLRGRSD
jgi:hypothetical protein